MFSSVSASSFGGWPPVHSSASTSEVNSGPRGRTRGHPTGRSGEDTPATPPPLVPPPPPSRPPQAPASFLGGVAARPQQRQPRGGDPGPRGRAPISPHW